MNDLSHLVNEAREMKPDEDKLEQIVRLTKECPTSPAAFQAAPGGQPTEPLSKATPPAPSRLRRAFPLTRQASRTPSTHVLQKGSN